MLSTALLLAITSLTPQPTHSASTEPMAQGTAATAAQADPLLTLHWGGLDKALADPRDAGLLAALKVADERLLEFAMTPAWDGPPPSVVRYVLDLLAQPLHVGAWLVDLEGAFPVRIEAEGDPDTLWNLTNGMIENVLKPMGMVASPDLANTGMFLFDSPEGPIHFGVSAIAPGEERFVVSFGDAPDIPAPTALSSGSAFLSLSIDSKPLQPLMRMGVEEEGGETGVLGTTLGMLGLLGETPMRIELEFAQAGGRSSMESRMHNASELMKISGYADQTPLTPVEVSKIPMGASFAQISRFELDDYLDLIKTLMADELGGNDDPFQMVTEMTGLDIAVDLVEPLGNSMGVYASPETGGGILSTTLFASVDDAETLTNSLNKLVELASGEMEKETEGHVRIEPWTMTSSDTHGWRIVFPQLPIPVEPCLLISDGWLYASLFPTSTITAAQQGRTGSPSILDQPGFREAFERLGRSEFISLQWMNTPEQLESGYSIVRLLGKALDNLILKPDGVASGQQTPVVPPYMDLVPNAKPSLVLGYWDGDVMGTSGTFDASWLVGIGGLADSYLGVALLFGLGTAAAEQSFESQSSAPPIYLQVAMDEPGQDSNQDTSAGDAVVAAIVAYHDENNAWPASLADLMQTPKSSAAHMHTVPLDPWGNAVIYVAPADAESWPSVLSYGADGAEGGFGEAEDIFYF